MTRKTSYDIINESRHNKAAKLELEFDIWEAVENHIRKFLADQKEWCSMIEKEGWLGEKYLKGKNGLLGYLRTGYAIQIRELENLDIALPIYSRDFDTVSFFRSDWFKNTTRENGSVKTIYKKEHFDFIKRENFIKA